MNIPFNRPYFTGKETGYIEDSIVNSGRKGFISYLTRCEDLIKSEWGFKEVYLTTSCTAALEISAILIDIKYGDEVIIPSYTFPSTANAFIRQGAIVRFADSRSDHPGIDEDAIEKLINEKTRAIIPVHYAGMACDMDKIMKIARKHKIYVIEDAAHAFDSFYKDQPLGSIGHIGCFSFHATKNVQCGDGGAIVLNDESFSGRISGILSKGTNKSDFYAGKVQRYEWVDTGSSFKMSEIHAASLLPQLEHSSTIRKRRAELWNLYFNSLRYLEDAGKLRIPRIKEFVDHNAHIFYLVLDNIEERNKLYSFLAASGIGSAWHYIPLETSRYWKNKNRDTKGNENSLRFGDCLLRLPLYHTMSPEDINIVVSSVVKYYSMQ